MRIDDSIGIYFSPEDAALAMSRMQQSSEAFVVIVRPELGPGYYVFYRQAAIDTISAFLAQHGMGPTLHEALDLHEGNSQPGVFGSQVDAAPEHSVVLENGIPVGVTVATPPRQGGSRFGMSEDLGEDGSSPEDGGEGSSLESSDEDSGVSRGQRAKPPIGEELREEEAVYEEATRGDEGDSRGATANGSSDVRPPVAVEAEPPEPPRYLVARTDEQVKVGTPFTLMSRIGAENLPTAPGQGGAAVAGNIAGKLKISIYAPGFTSNDGTQREIDVPLTGNSSWASFELVATKEGVQQIEVMAWRNSVQVGGLTISVGVGVGAVGVGQTQGDMDMRDPEVGEYTLEISFDIARNQYRFQLRSDEGDTWPPMYSPALIGTAQTNYQSVLTAMNTQARNANKLTPFAQEEWLQSMGKTLYSSLVPPELKQALWDNQSKIKFLNILSPGEPMPWELLYLTDPAGVASGGFIADVATVSRWRYGSPAGRSLKKGNPYLVLPQGSPPKADQEVKYVQQKLGNGNIIGKLDDLLRLLKVAHFSLLHFASHNVTNPAATGGLYIPFDDGIFDMTFSGGWSSKQFAAQSPLIFMNSCTSGGAAPLYTEMAGWAEKFLGAGCGAFIGSLWEVRDTSALTFSQTFYDQVTAGVTLGEAMRAARNALKASDPTYLAYTLYGNPLARLL